MSEIDYQCEDCGVYVDDYKPAYCCKVASMNCDCGGRPVEPCLCGECFDKLKKAQNEAMKRVWGGNVKAQNERND